MNDKSSDTDRFKAEYKSDKKRNGWFSIIVGVLFLVWTGFDIATNFYEEFWYANVFFIALGLIFIVFGIYDLKKYSRSNNNKRV